MTRPIKIVSRPMEEVAPGIWRPAAGMKAYRTIVADPPWKVHRPPPLSPGSFAKSGPNRPLPYSTMSVEDIAKLPVADLADERPTLPAA